MFGKMFRIIIFDSRLKLCKNELILGQFLLLFLQYVILGVSFPSSTKTEA